MNNIPQVKMGIIAVSRDCFPITLSEKRRKAVVEVLKNRGYDIYECPVIIEGGIDANVMEAYEDLKKSGININRKLLSELAITDKEAFANLVETAKKAL